MFFVFGGKKLREILLIELIFSDFLLTFAMPLMILLVFICSTKVSEKSDMARKDTFLELFA
jgi:hypothetical protein